MRSSNHPINRTPDPSKLKSYSPSIYGTSKTERFAPTKRTATPDFINPISTLSKRTCTFGFGTRYELKSLTGRDSPSPCAYTMPNLFERAKPGPVMTSSRTSRKIPKELMPGPGSYSPFSPLGKNSKKFSFRGRIAKKDKNESPPPDTYNPCFTLVTKGNFKDITFGIGERYRYRKNDLPGPGAYELPSIFQTDRSVSLKENLKYVNKK